MSSPDFVTSLQKGLEVLTCFSRQHARMTLSEVSRRTGASPASARRSLLTLQELGYLGSDGKYFWMLPRVLLIAHAYQVSRPTPSLAQPLLDAMSERTRESASLGMLQDDDVIIIARSTARRTLSTGLGIGSRMPTYCTAMGRVLLASMEPRQAVCRVRAMARPPLTPQTVTDADAVLQLVASCRAQGYATNEGELEVGVRSMAVPVLNRNGQTIAAMSIAMRTDRMGPGEFRDTFLPVLLRARNTLAPRLI